jgi:hypothetical protein
MCAHATAGHAAEAEGSTMSSIFPSIREVAQSLRMINRDAEGETDVRLCVWEDGRWCVNWGDVQYDAAHSDYCEAGSVSGRRRR